jgi:hypothetical protein
MKKEIIKQLLNEKPSITETSPAKISDIDDIIRRENDNRRDDYIYKYNYGTKTSRKLSYYDQLIFLRIFKAFSKRRKSINQFDKAEKLKSLFKEASSIHKFEYIDPYASEFNPKTKSYELIEFTVEAIQLAQVYGESFLIQIGLSQRLLVSRYGSQFNYALSMLACLEDIANYIIYATPAAIVQMNKRLRREHKK